MYKRIMPIKLYLWIILAGMNDAFDVPVLMLVFNRPDETRRVFEAVKEIRPLKLYVAADGPRPARADDVELSRRTREVFNEIDWPCTVHHLYRDQNLGCGPAVSSAITWFFSQEVEGIVLEDDCLPNHSFFYYCRELLEHYRGNEKVMHIAGANFHLGKKYGDGSYYFSMNNHVWGWASWRRAWERYDFSLNSIKNVSDLNLDEYTDNKGLIRFWKLLFITIKNKGINTWDYQWCFSILKNKGLSIVPNVNMVTNIGNTNSATHQGAENETWTMNLPSEELTNIIHPKEIKVSKEADNAYYMMAQKPNNTFIQKIRKTIRLGKLLINKG